MTKRPVPGHRTEPMRDRERELQCVLVVGAGPTGLTVAAELARQGVPCRVIDRALTASEKSKAIVIQARTLEIFSLMQIADDFVAAGKPLRGVNVYSNGKRMVSVHFDELDSAYPYILSLAQPETERILNDSLRRMGVTVERGVELLALSQDAEKATVELRHTDGRLERLRMDWVIGCDGARSTVRRALDIPFEGHTFEQHFLLADVHVESVLPDNEAHVFSQHGDICAVFPMPGGRYRIIADNPPVEFGDREPTLEECQAIVNLRVHTPITLSDPAWTANFRVNSRLVRALRTRRVFLAGDAAHIHSPAGGQGMNTGIQDAVNLAWKLALVCKGKSHPSLLDSYQAERYPVERAVLRQTDTAFRIAGAGGGIGAFVREHVVPLIGNLKFLQREAARLVSEIGIEYEHSPIVEDHFVPGGPRAGDRAPDATARLAPDGREIRVLDLCSRPEHTLLLVTETDSQLAIAKQVSTMVARPYGEVITTAIITDSVEAAVDAQKRRSLRDEYGTSRPTMYLIRPDGYIGFRAPITPGAKELMEYLGKKLISTG
jgi:2-polyprenyl-6-methoxyphenol hydroxylase-like FAD-dependent oxidoreductase